MLPSFPRFLLLPLILSCLRPSVTQAAGPPAASALESTSISAGPTVGWTLDSQTPCRPTPQGCAPLRGGPKQYQLAQRTGRIEGLVFGLEHFVWRGPIGLRVRGGVARSVLSPLPQRKASAGDPQLQGTAQLLLRVALVGRGSMSLHLRSALGYRVRTWQVRVDPDGPGQFQSRRAQHSLVGELTLEARIDRHLELQTTLLLGLAHHDLGPVPSDVGLQLGLGIRPVGPLHVAVRGGIHRAVLRTPEHGSSPLDIHAERITARVEVALGVRL